MKKISKIFSIALIALLICLSFTGCKKPVENPDIKNNTGVIKRDVPVAEAGLSNMLGSGKLYLTTFGQADRDYLAEIVDEAIGDAAIKYEKDNQLQAKNVESGSLVIAVVGYTSKGISGEITQTGEVNRAKEFAEKQDIKLVIVQLSGKTRRGDSTDPIIEQAVKGAELVMIFDPADSSNGANFDNKYSDVWCVNTPLFMFTDEWDMNEYIAKIIGAK